MSRRRGSLITTSQYGFHNDQEQMRLFMGPTAMRTPEVKGPTRQWQQRLDAEVSMIGRVARTIEVIPCAIR